MSVFLIFIKTIQESEIDTKSHKNHTKSHNFTTKNHQNVPKMSKNVQNISIASTGALVSGLASKNCSIFHLKK